jgi:heme-degrading monooxygenase HmoA
MFLDYSSKLTHYGNWTKRASEQINHVGYLKCPPGQSQGRENDMYARQVSMDLKPNSTAEFTQKLEAEIIPLLRKQKGFQDEIAFINPAGKEAIAVSLWDSKESAEAYNRGPYAEVTKLLSKLVDGTPRVKAYEVANSTFHKIGVKLKAA